VQGERSAQNHGPFPSPFPQPGGNAALTGQSDTFHPSQGSGGFPDQQELPAGKATPASLLEETGGAPSWRAAVV